VNVQVLTSHLTIFTPPCENAHIKTKNENKNLTTKIKIKMKMKIKQTKEKLAISKVIPLVPPRK
jgi:hypothetical protein